MRLSSQTRRLVLGLATGLSVFLLSYAANQAWGGVLGSMLAVLLFSGPHLALTHLLSQDAPPRQTPRCDPRRTGMQAGPHRPPPDRVPSRV